MPKISDKKRHASSDPQSEERENGGMSRAAKKRAKKRQKKQISEKNPVILETGNREDGKRETSDLKKVDKLELPMEAGARGSGVTEMETRKGPNESETILVTKIQKEKAKKVRSKEDDDESNDGEQLGGAIEALLSRLTPAEILFPSVPIKENKNDSSLENIPDPQQLIRDVTSKARARILFNSLLQPAGITARDFFRTYWEKRPLLITDSSVNSGEKGSRGDLLEHKNRLSGFLTKSNIERTIASSALRYGRDLNVTHYTTQPDGTKRRITLDLPPTSSGDQIEHPVAEPTDIWSNFDSGCSIRLLCPHQHYDAVHALLSTLELEFGCMVGSNAYLTPPSNSQGFAPHYDDIEAFVLQLEGSKRWRVYPPLNATETLPRESSVDYTEKDLEGIEPVIDEILGPGDVLYMPRGWIHQAHTPLGKLGSSAEHSLHLTVSAMQNWAWVDLLENLMPEALESVARSDKSTILREGLPRDFLGYMGVMHDLGSEDLPEGLRQVAESTAAATKSEDVVGGTEVNGPDVDETEQEESRRIERIKFLRTKFKEEAKKRIMRVCREAISMIDDGCDRIGKRFLLDRLPPAYDPSESSLTSESRTNTTGGKIWPNTLCRLARPGIARLVLEDGKAILYHCGDNSRVYHENPLSPMEFDVDDAPALETLLTTVEPHWVSVKDLVHGDIEDKIDIAQALYDEGILATYQAERPDKTIQVG